MTDGPTDAECVQLYRWLRSAKGDWVDETAADLWELLITKGCTGSRFDATVKSLMELDADHE